MTMIPAMNIGADGAKATAINPARSGGRAWPRELNDALMPNVSPLSFGGIRKDKRAPKFACCKPFGIAKMGVMINIHQACVGNK